MRVSFPHIGNAYIAIKTMCERLDVDYVIPSLSTQRTMSLATKYSPEGLCIPFKLNLGNFIEALEGEADTLINVAGYGTCRMGYYYKVQEEILRDMGYDFEMILFGLSERKFQGFMDILRRVSGGAPWREVISAFAFGISKMTALDDLEIKMNEVRAIEAEKGISTRIFREGIDAIDKTDNPKALQAVTEDYLSIFARMDKKDLPDPLKILIVGEIYVVLDPYANMDVELELNKLGAVTRRSLYISRWLKRSLLLSPLKIDQWGELHKAAKPYLKRDIGGDGWETVGEKVAAVGEYDGIVHMAPFTCMPEVSAQNIMQSMKEGVPVISIYCDEQTSKAGLVTRLEAFVDMLGLKRHYKKKELRV
ncbi:MAG: CoA protein activase [Chloroflexi bacterium]|nr:CoA protein activase [Chloroflexota bacterium]